MNNEEKKDKIIAVLEECGNDIFEVLDVAAVNHNPHPYMIGPRHIKESNIYIDADVCNRIPCALSGCGLFYKDHTYDTVCFLRLQRDASNDEVNVLMKAMVDKLDEAFIDGFAFVENKLYTITK